MEEIYKKYSILVYNYLYRLTNNKEISEELTQETFYSAIKKIHTLKKQESVNVWLCQIAKNKWNDYLRKNKKIKLISFNDELGESILNNDLEERFLDKEAVFELYSKIHKLDINTREVIYLKLKTDFTFKEIGKILGKSETWAKTTFFRGKNKLKEEFNNEK